MDFFKNLKDKVNDVLFVRDEEYDEDEEITEQAQEHQPQHQYEEPSYDEMTPPPYNSYSYSPTGGLHAPEYEFSKPSSASSAPEYKFTKPSQTASAPEGDRRTFREESDRIFCYGL